MSEYTPEDIEQALSDADHAANGNAARSEVEKAREAVVEAAEAEPGYFCPECGRAKKTPLSQGPNGPCCGACLRQYLPS